MIKWIKRIFYSIASLCMIVNAQQISYGTGFGCLIQKYNPITESNLNCFGQITNQPYSNTLYNIPHNTNFTQISCANSRCCGILTNNTISCIGPGYNYNDTLPIKITDKTNELSTQVLVTYDLTCAITIDKYLRCWRLPPDMYDQNMNQTYTTAYDNNSKIKYERLFKSSSSYYDFYVQSEYDNLLNNYAKYLKDGITYFDLNEYYLEFNKNTSILSSYSDLCNGNMHACGIRKNDSKIDCWGDDTYGQLQIQESYLEYSFISCGYRSTCGITSLDSRVVCWGDDTYGQISIPANLKAIQIDSDMERSTCGVLLSKKPFCVGEYMNLPHEPVLKIGIGDYITCGYMPSINLLKCIGINSVEMYVYNTISEIKCRKNVCCWLTDNNTGIYCFGKNYYFPNTNVYTQIALGSDHICVLTINNRILCNADSGIIGPGIVPNYNYVYVTSYNTYSCAIRNTDLRIICWGNNIPFQILNNMQANNFKKISLGENFICGIIDSNTYTNNTLQCWGSSMRDFSIVPPSGYFEQITCFKSSCCGKYLNYNSIVCWGKDVYNIPNGISFTDVGLGYKHACGITTDYKIHCWGDNLYGQIIHDEFNNEIEQLAPPSTYKIGSKIQSCNNSYSFSSGSITPICSGYCDKGTYSNLSIRSAYTTPYSTKCNYDCPRGYYCPYKSYMPIKCPAGLYNNMLNQETCYLECPVGSYCPEGTDTPINCPAGRYSDTVGSISCTNCPIGKISSKGDSFCTSCLSGFTKLDQSACLSNTCPAGRYSEIINNTTFTGVCIDCPIKTTSKAGESSCSLCDIDSYSYKVGTSYPCQSCTNVLGIKCQPKSIDVNSGIYAWINNDTGLTSIRCQPHMCIGGTIDDMCHPTREGILCGKCKDGYTLQGSKCVSCDKPNIGLIFLVIFAIICYNNFIHFISQLPEKRAGVKILIYYIQVVSMTTYPLSDYLSWISFIDFNPKSTGSLCLFPMTSFQTITLNTCMPLIFYGFFVFQIIIHKNLSKKFSSIEFDIKKYIKTFENMLLFVINNLIISSVQYISCISVPSLGSFNYRNPSIDCNSSQYKNLYPLFILILINGFVSIPTFTYILSNKFKKIIAIYKFNEYSLFDKFIHTYYYPFALLRRFIIALVANIIFNDRDKYLSLSICNLIFLICHVICMPYTETIDNYAEFLSLFILTILSIALTHTPPPFEGTQDQLIFFFLILIPTLILLSNVLYWFEYRKIYTNIKTIIINIINKFRNCRCTCSCLCKTDNNLDSNTNNTTMVDEKIEMTSKKDNNQELEFQKNPICDSNLV